MSYIHYGRIGDIWKHIPLCNFLVNEKPRFYIETNSAQPNYQLTHSPERDYGIYTILNSALKSDIIKNSVFYQTLINYKENLTGMNEYLGSPGLAMNVLHDSVERYIFCDVEDESLDAITKYSIKFNISKKVQTYKNDSIKTIDSLINNFSPSDFIHIDPYSIIDKNNEGRTFFDIFLDSIKKGIKSMLWYGYENNYQRKYLLKWMKEKTKSSYIPFNNNIILIELFLSSIQENEVIVNPGVVGCGIVIGNLSKKSIDEFDMFSNELIEIYHGSIIFEKYNGSIEKEKFML
jgi:23S rRNA (adenine2030-N6)-methyltransferase